jgi:hypothetical protein
MPRSMDRYRKNVDGSPKHDGDCWFWDAKICTCGLLHDVQGQQEEESLVLLGEMMEHERSICLSQLRLETLKEIKRSCEHCKEIANKAIEGRTPTSPNELCLLLHQAGLEVDLWFASSLFEKQVEEAARWAYWASWYNWEEKGWVGREWDGPDKNVMPDFLARLQQDPGQK